MEHRSFLCAYGRAARCIYAAPSDKRRVFVSWPNLPIRSHASLFARGGFPSTSNLTLRPSLRIDKLDFKVAEISKRIEADPQGTFILIGDNTEKDIEVFERVRSNYPGADIDSYIHVDSNTNIPQIETMRSIPFLTGFDLAILLLQTFQIDDVVVVKMIRDLKLLLSNRFLHSFSSSVNAKILEKVAAAQRPLVSKHRGTFDYFHRLLLGYDINSFMCMVSRFMSF